MPVHGKSPVTIQPKLTINTPGDAFEQEADRIAEQVMRMSQLAAPRAHAHGPVAQRTATQQAIPAIAPPIVHGVLRSPGQPLDRGTRAFMESRFGYDFGKVRVHVDTQAAEAASSIAARAFTSGQSVVFGAGAYAPQTKSGRGLIAHELTHVVQQAGVHLKDGVSERGDPYERQAASGKRQADAIADELVHEKASEGSRTARSKSMESLLSSGSARTAPQGRKEIQ
jgi:hypothetical protein